jgi:hypothetical protein
VQDVGGTSREGRDRVDRRDLCHALALPLLAGGQARFNLAHALFRRSTCALAQVLVAHHDALAVGADDQQVVLGFARRRALLVERIEVLRGPDRELLDLTLREGGPREVVHRLDDLVERVRRGFLRDHAPDPVREHLPGQVERRVHRMKIRATRRLIREPLHPHAPQHSLEVPLAVARRRAFHPVGPDDLRLPLQLRSKPKVLFEHQPSPLLALAVEHRLKVRVRLPDHLVARNHTLDLQGMRSRFRERDFDTGDRFGMNGAHRKDSFRSPRAPSPPERHTLRANSRKSSKLHHFRLPRWSRTQSISRHRDQECLDIRGTRETLDVLETGESGLLRDVLGVVTHPRAEEAPYARHVPSQRRDRDASVTGVRRDRHCPIF